MRGTGFGKVAICAVFIVALLNTGANRDPSLAVGPSPTWSINSDAYPTNFAVTDTRDQIQELAVTATSGTYELWASHIGSNHSTAPIKWNASPAEVQGALEAVPQMRAVGNVTVIAGPGGSQPYRVTWDGAWSGNSPGLLKVSENLLLNNGEPGTAVSHIIQQQETRDSYILTIINESNVASAGVITIDDKTPAGLVPIEAVVEEPRHSSDTCTVSETAPFKVICQYEEPVASGHELVVDIKVALASSSREGLLTNTATVMDSSGDEATTKMSNALSTTPATFGLADFAMKSDRVAGGLDEQAGDHPSSLTTNIDLNTVRSTGLYEYSVTQEVRSIAVELPLGLVGDPLAAPRCREIELTDSYGALGSGRHHTACSPASQVGVVRPIWDGGVHAETYPVYNVVPERGYPAEFGFNAGLGQPIFMYASVVPSPSGYRLRVTAPGTLRGAAEVEGVLFTVFGNPGERDGIGDATAFLTNPTHCSDEPESARVEVTSWDGSDASAETMVYPQLTGCNAFQGGAAFNADIAVEPETHAADSPSGYTVSVKLPQAPGIFGTLATPYLKNIRITLPPGVAISPAAANGPDALTGCTEEEIDLLGTEKGEGHPGGNVSPYDDGMIHASSGHCPENSRIGEVEVKTPVLAAPLHGHMYVAQPSCGGPGQPVCTEAAAENGEVFGVYLEVVGSGVIVKEAGAVEVGGYGKHSRETGLAPGQVRVRFDEVAQFPLEEVKVTTAGGQRTPFANPQTCGTATTTSNLEPWSAPESGPNATPSSSFTVEGCNGPMPFKPGFTAGTLTPIAGGYSPFVLELSRHDGEQDLTGVETTLPKGLLAKLAGVPECGEAEANAGTCSSASQIGTLTVSVGAGSEPLVQTGRVYLTGPYNNGPFGEVVVVPAIAGPFNLGNVVVRGSIRINPETAQASIVSNPFPTFVDGVPIRVKNVDVEVNRPDFTFNPTDCDEQAVTGTVTAEQGGSEAVSSPFAVTGCAHLPFKPSFKTFTRGMTSRVDGASLTVKVAEKPGEANIHTVRLQFPKALPARLATLRKACTAAQFAANPAGCPEGSVIGTGTAVTPVLGMPLNGPAYIVSHGGAAYPDVVFVLQGDGVKIDLTGHTDIKKGVTYSTFETVPDAPVTSFEAVLPEGPHAVFGANLPAKAKGSFCGRKLVVGTTLQGQNGAVVRQSTAIKVTGCPRVRHKEKRRGAKSHKK